MMKRGILPRAVLFAALVAAACAFAESPNITVFRPAVNPRDKNDNMVRAAEEYKKQTGGKVTFVISDWNNWQPKILTYMAAGEPIDVIFARDADFPQFYVKGYLQPINGLVNLDVPYLNKGGMDMAFKYEGKYYLASQSTSNHPWMIIYNKSLMEEEGIPENQQPIALNKAGKWNWANLRSLAIKLTKDTAGTGKIDRWGFGNWWTRGFAYMNGTTFTTTDKAGNLKLNFDDQRLMEALTFLADAKKEGWYMQDNSIAGTGIQKRQVAMLMEREYVPVQILAQTKDELCYVPLPFGPGNKDKKNIFEADGYGIGNGSKNPGYAGKYIDICLKVWYEDDLRGRARWPEEVLALSKEMEKKPFYPGTTASALDSMLDQFLGEIVWTGNSASTAIASYKAKAESMILDANKPMEKPVQLPFKSIKADFENGDISAFPVMNKDLKSVKLSIISDDRAINGKSLLVEMDPAVDSKAEFIDAILTDPEKFGVVGWRSYQITFDVKALSAPLSADTFAYVQVFRDKDNSYGWITQKLEAANTVYKVKGYANNIMGNGKFGLRIGGHSSNSFVIDNIEIIEKK
jgi:multiple sugar transport system substrate-binding protein